MKRQPSIHVTELELALALDKVFSRELLYGNDINILAKQLVTLLRTKTLINRSIIISNDKVENKARRILASNRGDADLMANIIYNYRKKLRHYGITQIKPGSRDWTTLKEITKLALDFCNDFGLNKREGFIDYITIAYSKVGSPTNMLNKIHLVMNKSKV